MKDLERYTEACNYPGEIERKQDHTLQMIRAVFDSSALDNEVTPVCASYIAAPSEKP